jgi:hypothetical protein
MRPGTSLAVSAAISRISGIPNSITSTVVRRLGETGLIPRGSRGQRLRRVNSLHCARVLLGVMWVDAGLRGNAFQAAAAVEKMEELRNDEDVFVAVGETAAEIERDFLIAKRGSFPEELAYPIECVRSNADDIRTRISAVVLAFDRNGFRGWVELAETAEYFGTPLSVRRIGGATCIVYERRRTPRLEGYTREARVEIGALEQIVRAWCEDAEHEEATPSTKGGT